MLRGILLLLVLVGIRECMKRGYGRELWIAVLAGILIEATKHAVLR